LRQEGRETDVEEPDNSRNITATEVRARQAEHEAKWDADWARARAELAANVNTELFKLLARFTK
jgi:hypothetical protein